LFNSARKSKTLKQGTLCVYVEETWTKQINYNTNGLGQRVFLKRKKTNYKTVLKGEKSFVMGNVRRVWDDLPDSNCSLF
jgi:hypothetical protein